MSFKKGQREWKDPVADFSPTMRAFDADTPSPFLCVKTHLARPTPYAQRTTRLVLDGFDAAPRAVLREGKPARFEFDPERGELTLVEQDAANLPLYVIVP